MWTPISLEDNLLHKYWKHKRGILYLEVPIGNSPIWPKGSRIRRIDGIRIVSQTDEKGKIARYNHSHNLSEIIKGKKIELIEAKQKLNRLVIGQVIVGIYMFKKQYRAKNVQGLILCEKSDPALLIVCKKLGIQVRTVNES